jgi:hypothetical protein
MKKNKNSKENSEIEKKVIIVKDILNNVYQIMALFKPMLELMLETEEAKLFQKNGTFEKMAFLFGKITDYCKELENPSQFSN